MSAIPASKRLSDLGEGPHWDEKTQKLYYVDAFVGDICRLDPITGETEAVHLDGTVTFVIPCQKDPRHQLISIGKQVHKLDFEEKTSQLIAVVDPDNPKSRFNDAKCDPLGRLWTGTLVEGQPEAGHLYKMDSSYNFQPFADKISLSNGITWSLDYKTMFYVDSSSRKIYSFEYDVDDGSVKNQKIFVDYNKDEGYSELGFPDGMTTDREGKLWVACYDGGCVIRVDPITGHILRKIEIPASKVTSCCFGGPHLDVLFVTTASRDLSCTEKEKQPQAGAVFAINGIDLKGQPQISFAD